MIWFKGAGPIWIVFGLGWAGGALVAQKLR